LAAAGCGDDNGPSGAGPPDAAVDAPVTAADAPVDAPPVDAAPPVFSDAGIYTTPVTPNDANCGIDGLGQDCNLMTSTCCFTVGGGNVCPAIGTPADALPACLFDMTCDGPEDCSNGQSCCIRLAGG